MTTKIQHSLASNRSLKEPNEAIHKDKSRTVINNKTERRLLDSKNDAIRKCKPTQCKSVPRAVTITIKDKLGCDKDVSRGTSLPNVKTLPKQICKVDKDSKCTNPSENTDSYKTVANNQSRKVECESANMTTQCSGYTVPKQRVGVSTKMEKDGRNAIVGNKPISSKSMSLAEKSKSVAVSGDSGKNGAESTKSSSRQAKPVGAASKPNEDNKNKTSTLNNITTRKTSSKIPAPSNTSSHRVRKNARDDQHSDITIDKRSNKVPPTSVIPGTDKPVSINSKSSSATPLSVTSSVSNSSSSGDNVSVKTKPKGNNKTLQSATKSVPSKRSLISHDKKKNISRMQSSTVSSKNKSAVNSATDKKTSTLKRGISSNKVTTNSLHELKTSSSSVSKTGSTKITVLKNKNDDEILTILDDNSASAVPIPKPDVSATEHVKPSFNETVDNMNVAVEIKCIEVEMQSSKVDTLCHDTSPVGGSCSVESYAKTQPTSPDETCHVYPFISELITDVIYGSVTAPEDKQQPSLLSNTVSVVNKRRTTKGNVGNITAGAQTTLKILDKCVDIPDTSDKQNRQRPDIKANCTNKRSSKTPINCVNLTETGEVSTVRSVKTYHKTSSRECNVSHLIRRPNCSSKEKIPSASTNTGIKSSRQNSRSTETRLTSQTTGRNKNNTDDRGNNIRGISAAKGTNNSAAIKRTAHVPLNKKSVHPVDKTSGNKGAIIAPLAQSASDRLTHLTHLRRSVPKRLRNKQGNELKPTPASVGLKQIRNQSATVTVKNPSKETEFVSTQVTPESTLNSSDGFEIKLCTLSCNTECEPTSKETETLSTYIGCDLPIPLENLSESVVCTCSMDHEFNPYKATNCSFCSAIMNKPDNQSLNVDVYNEINLSTAGQLSLDNYTPFRGDKGINAEDYSDQQVLECFRSSDPSERIPKRVSPNCTENEFSDKYDNCKCITIATDQAVSQQSQCTCNLSHQIDLNTSASDLKTGVSLNGLSANVPIFSDNGENSTEPVQQSDAEITLQQQNGAAKLENNLHRIYNNKVFCKFDCETNSAKCAGLSLIEGRRGNKLQGNNTISLLGANDDMELNSVACIPTTCADSVTGSEMSIKKHNSSDHRQRRDSAVTCSLYSMDNSVGISNACDHTVTDRVTQNEFECVAQYDRDICGSDVNTNDKTQIHPKIDPSAAAICCANLHNETMISENKINSSGKTRSEASGNCDSDLASLHDVNATGIENDGIDTPARYRYNSLMKFGTAINQSTDANNVTICPADDDDVMTSGVNNSICTDVDKYTSRATDSNTQNYYNNNNTNTCNVYSGENSACSASANTSACVATNYRRRCEVISDLQSPTISEYTHCSSALQSQSATNSVKHESLSLGIHASIQNQNQDCSVGLVYNGAVTSGKNRYVTENINTSVTQSCTPVSNKLRSMPIGNGCVLKETDSGEYTKQQTICKPAGGGYHMESVVFTDVSVTDVKLNKEINDITKISQVCCECKLEKCMEIAENVHMVQNIFHSIEQPTEMNTSLCDSISSITSNCLQTVESTEGLAVSANDIHSETGRDVYTDNPDNDVFVGSGNKEVQRHPVKSGTDIVSNYSSVSDDTSVCKTPDQSYSQSDADDILSMSDYKENVSTRVGFTDHDTLCADSFGCSNAVHGWQKGNSQLPLFSEVESSCAEYNGVMGSITQDILAEPVPVSSVPIICDCVSNLRQTLHSADLDFMNGDIDQMDLHKSVSLQSDLSNADTCNTLNSTNQLCMDKSESCDDASTHNESIIPRNSSTDNISQQAVLRKPDDSDEYPTVENADRACIYSHALDKYCSHANNIPEAGNICSACVKTISNENGRDCLSLCEAGTRYTSQDSHKLTADIETAVLPVIDVLRCAPQHNHGCFLSCDEFDNCNKYAVVTSDAFRTRDISLECAEKCMLLHSEMDIPVSEHCKTNNPQLMLGDESEHIRVIHVCNEVCNQVFCDNQCSCNITENNHANILLVNSMNTDNCNQSGTGTDFTQSTEMHKNITIPSTGSKLNTVCVCGKRNLEKPDCHSSSVMTSEASKLLALASCPPAEQQCSKVMESNVDINNQNIQIFHSKLSDKEVMHLQLSDKQTSCDNIDVNFTESTQDCVQTLSTLCTHALTALISKLGGIYGNHYLKDTTPQVIWKPVTTAITQLNQHVHNSAPVYSFNTTDKANTYDQSLDTIRIKSSSDVLPSLSEIALESSKMPNLQNISPHWTSGEAKIHGVDKLTLLSPVNIIGHQSRCEHQFPQVLSEPCYFNDSLIDKTPDNFEQQLPLSLPDESTKTCPTEYNGQLPLTVVKSGIDVIIDELPIIINDSCKLPADDVITTSVPVISSTDEPGVLIIGINVCDNAADNGNNDIANYVASDSNLRTHIGGNYKRDKSVLQCSNGNYTLSSKQCGGLNNNTDIEFDYDNIYAVIDDKYITPGVLNVSNDGNYVNCESCDAVDIKHVLENNSIRNVSDCEENISNSELCDNDNVTARVLISGDEFDNTPGVGYIKVDKNCKGQCNEAGACLQSDSQETGLYLNATVGNSVNSLCNNVRNITEYTHKGNILCGVHVKQNNVECAIAGSEFISDKSIVDLGNQVHLQSNGDIIYENGIAHDLTSSDDNKPNIGGPIYIDQSDSTSIDEISYETDSETPETESFDRTTADEFSLSAVLTQAGEALCERIRGATRADICGVYLTEGGEALCDNINTPSECVDIFDDASDSFAEADRQSPIILDSCSISSFSAWPSNACRSTSCNSVEGSTSIESFQDAIDELDVTNSADTDELFYSLSNDSLEKQVLLHGEVLPEPVRHRDYDDINSFVNNPSIEQQSDSENDMERRRRREHTVIHTVLRSTTSTESRAFINRNSSVLGDTGYLCSTPTSMIDKNSANVSRSLEIAHRTGQFCGPITTEGTSKNVALLREINTSNQTMRDTLHENEQTTKTTRGIQCIEHNDSTLTPITASRHLIQSPSIEREILQSEDINNQSYEQSNSTNVSTIKTNDNNNTQCQLTTTSIHGLDNVITTETITTPQVVESNSVVRMVNKPRRRVLVVHSQIENTACIITDTDMKPLSIQNNPDGIVDIFKNSQDLEDSHVQDSSGDNCEHSELIHETPCVTNSSEMSDNIVLGVAIKNSTLSEENLNLKSKVVEKTGIDPCNNNESTETSLDIKPYVKESSEECLKKEDNVAMSENDNTDDSTDYIASVVDATIDTPKTRSSSTDVFSFEICPSTPTHKQYNSEDGIQYNDTNDLNEISTNNKGSKTNDIISLTLDVPSAQKMVHNEKAIETPNIIAGTSHMQMKKQDETEDDNIRSISGTSDEVNLNEGHANEPNEATISIVESNKSKGKCITQQIECMNIETSYNHIDEKPIQCETKKDVTPTVDREHTLKNETPSSNGCIDAENNKSIKRRSSACPVIPIAETGKCITPAWKSAIKKSQSFRNETLHKLEVKDTTILSPWQSSIKKSQSFGNNPGNMSADTDSYTETSNTFKSRNVADICKTFIRNARSGAIRSAQEKNIPQMISSPIPQRKLMQWVNHCGKWQRIPVEELPGAATKIKTNVISETIWNTEVNADNAILVILDESKCALSPELDTETGKSSHSSKPHFAKSDICGNVCESAQPVVQEIHGDNSYKIKETHENTFIEMKISENQAADNQVPITILQVQNPREYSLSADPLCQSESQIKADIKPNALGESLHDLDIEDNFIGSIQSKTPICEPESGDVMEETMSNGTRYQPDNVEELYTNNSFDPSEITTTTKEHAASKIMDKAVDCYQFITDENDTLPIVRGRLNQELPDDCIKCQPDMSEIKVNKVVTDLGMIEGVEDTALSCTRNNTQRFSITIERVDGDKPSDYVSLQTDHLQNTGDDEKHMLEGVEAITCNTDDAFEGNSVVIETVATDDEIKHESQQTHDHTMEMYESTTDNKVNDDVEGSVQQNQTESPVMDTVTAGNANVHEPTNISHQSHSASSLSIHGETTEHVIIHKMDNLPQPGQGSSHVTASINSDNEIKLNSGTLSEPYQISSHVTEYMAIDNEIDQEMETLPLQKQHTCILSDNEIKHEQETLRQSDHLLPIESIITGNESEHEQEILHQPKQSKFVTDNIGGEDEDKLDPSIIPEEIDNSIANLEDSDCQAKQMGNEVTPGDNKDCDKTNAMCNLKISPVTTDVDATVCTDPRIIERDVLNGISSSPLPTVDSTGLSTVPDDLHTALHTEATAPTTHVINSECIDTRHSQTVCESSGEDNKIIKTLDTVTSTTPVSPTAPSCSGRTNTNEMCEHIDNTNALAGDAETDIEIEISDTVSCIQMTRREFLFGLRDNFNRRKPSSLLPTGTLSQTSMKSKVKPDAKNMAMMNKASNEICNISITSNNQSTEDAETSHMDNGNLNIEHMVYNKDENNESTTHIPKLKAVKIQEEIFEGNPEYMKECNKFPLDIDSLEGTKEAIRAIQYKIEQKRKEIKLGRQKANHKYNVTDNYACNTSKIPTLNIKKSQTVSGLKDFVNGGNKPTFYIGDKSSSSHEIHKPEESPRDPQSYNKANKDKPPATGAGGKDLNQIKSNMKSLFPAKSNIAPHQSFPSKCVSADFAVSPGVGTNLNSPKAHGGEIVSSPTDDGRSRSLGRGTAAKTEDNERRQLSVGSSLERHKMLLSEIVEDVEDGATDTPTTKGQGSKHKPSRLCQSHTDSTLKAHVKRSLKHRSLSLPTGTLAFGDARIVYKNGHFTIETQDGIELDTTRSTDPHETDRPSHIDGMHSSPEHHTGSPREVSMNGVSERENTHRPVMRRQVGKSVLTRNSSADNVFKDETNREENWNKADCRVPRTGQSHQDFSKSGLSKSANSSFTENGHCQKEPAVRSHSSSSLPDGPPSDLDAKCTVQRARRTSSFRQAQQAGAIRLSGIQEDGAHTNSRKRTESQTSVDSQSSDLDQTISSQNAQNTTFFKKMMAKRKSFADTLNMSSFSKQNDSAKDFFSKKMSLKGLFKKSKSSDLPETTPVRPASQVVCLSTPPIATFESGSDIGCVDSTPRSPFRKPELSRRHTSADIYANPLSGSLDSSINSETDSNCPTPTMDHTPSKKSSSVILPDDDQTSINSTSTTSSVHSSHYPLEQPNKPKTPKPVGASPRRNPSLGSQYSRSNSQNSQRNIYSSETSLESDGFESHSIGSSLNSEILQQLKREYENLTPALYRHRKLSDNVCNYQNEADRLNQSSTSLGSLHKLTTGGENGNFSDEHRKRFEKEVSLLKKSYEKLAVLAQAEITSSNSNDSGIQHDVSVHSSSESLKGTPELQVKLRRQKSTSPRPDRPKSEAGVRWADLDISDLDVPSSPVQMRVHGPDYMARPRPVSDIEDNIQLFDELFMEVLEDFDTEGSSFLSDRMKAFGSEVNLQPYCSLRSLYELRRRDHDTNKQKNRRMSTPHPIKCRLQRVPRKLHKQAPLLRSSSMPESLDKAHKRRKLHHLLDFHTDSLTRHMDVDDCFSDDSDISFSHISLQEKSLSIQSSHSHLTSMDEEVESLTYAEALWDHITMDPEELGFRAGDLIDVTDMADKDWWFGEIEDRDGWFPAAFVRLRVNQETFEDDPDVTLREDHSTSPKVRRISTINKNQARTNVVNEIINAEREYVKHLKDVVDGYIQHARKRSEMFSQERISLIFGNIEVIYRFACKFLSQLELCIDVCPHLSEIGQAFIDNEHGFEIYSDYCNNHPSACEELKDLYRNAKYRHFFEACRLLQELVEIPLEGFLLTPVQKICKYPLQLAELLKYTPPDHADYSKVKAALSSMRKIATLINERKRKMESIEKIAAWQQTVVDWEDEELLLRSSELIYSGDVNKVNSAGWSQERYFFLFDHQLIYCKKELLKRHVFSYKGRIDLDHCDVHPVPDGKVTQYNVTVKNGWKLHETHRDKWYLLYAKTAAGKDRWLKAFADERRRVKEDAENDFCVPFHWRQTVMNKVRSQSSLKDKQNSSRSIHTLGMDFYKDIPSHATLPRTRRVTNNNQEKKKGWFNFGGGKKSKR